MCVAQAEKSESSLLPINASSYKQLLTLGVEPPKVNSWERDMATVHRGELKLL